jgi:hypothetical protein
VIDSAKALRRAIADTFGARAFILVIQRAWMAPEKRHTTNCLTSRNGGDLSFICHSLNGEIAARSGHTAQYPNFR